MKRPHISHKVGLAAALIQIANDEEFYEHSKLMTADQIISCFVRDHCPIRKADGGPDAPWNLTWRFIGAHREKTAKVDVPEMAKSKRIRAKQARHRERVSLAAANAELNALKWDPPLRKWPARKIPSRPFRTNKRKLKPLYP